jgi:hypothetical protein
MQRGSDQSYIATAIAVGAIRAGRRALVRSTFKRIGVVGVLLQGHEESEG